MVTRGGKRDGAGRPRKDDGLRRHFGCRLKEDNIEWIQSEKERTGCSIGELVDLAVEVLQKHPEELPPDAVIEADEENKDEK